MNQPKLICPFGHKCSVGQRICSVCGADLIVARTTPERYWQGGYDNIFLDRNGAL